MDAVSTCPYCGSQSSASQMQCLTCHKSLSGEVDIKLLTDALNAPVLFKDYSTGCSFYAILFFGLLGILTGFFRMNDFVERGSTLLAYALIASGVIMIVALIALRIRQNLALLLLFAIATTVQGIIVVTTTKFLSPDFFTGIALLLFGGTAFWQVPDFMRLSKIPKPILEHALNRRARIFSPKKEDVPVLLLFEGEKGSAEQAWRILLEEPIAMIGFVPKNRVRVLPRSQFSIAMQKPFVSGGETKAVVHMEGKQWTGKVSPAFWEIPKEGEKIS